MIKKIIFILVLSFVTFSCGKKGDPVYKDPKNKAELKSILINKV